MSPMPISRADDRRSASRTQRSGPMPAGSPMVTAMGALAFMGRRSGQRLDLDTRGVAEDFHLDVGRRENRARSPAATAILACANPSSACDGAPNTQSASSGLSGRSRRCAARRARAEARSLRGRTPESDRASPGSGSPACPRRAAGSTSRTTRREAARHRLRRRARRSARPAAHRRT